jgi:hypothetical protein
LPFMVDFGRPSGTGDMDCSNKAHVSCVIKNWRRVTTSWRRVSTQKGLGTIAFSWRVCKPFRLKVMLPWWIGGCQPEKWCPRQLDVASTARC